ncbi:YbaK/EbsC family protein [Clostridium paraputrificum]|uniref:YbaK/EbsC family protein n=1 Tax=Clostridium paraputrificum TaxID=29363 RepID=UPI0034A41A95
MTIEKVRDFLKGYGKDKYIREFDTSSATVELAAEALDVEPARIAKSLTFKNNEKCIMVVTAGDREVDNRKFKNEFGIKAKMLSPDEVYEFTGHRVGGVCPFVIDLDKVQIYCDKSMERFQTVFPACGSSNSAIELTLDELFKLSNALKWVDICK